MEEIVKFLKECNTFYLATVDENGQPHVRPFGAAYAYEGRLYIVTNNQKKVFDQMKKNPKIEISGMANGKWIRLEAEAVLDTRREARVAAIEDYAELGNMYNVDDGKMAVLYLQNATASICSFTAEPEVYKF